MSQSLAQALDGPIVRDGHTFPVWRTRDLIPLMAELTAKRVAVLKKAVDEMKVPEREKAYMLARDESQGVSALDCYNYLTSVAGVDECLGKSLQRGGMTPEAATAYLDDLRFDIKMELAMRVSNIMEYSPVPPETDLPTVKPSEKNKGKGLGDPGQTVPPEPQGLGSPK